MKNLLNLKILLFLAILAAAIFLRFYKLNWGDGLYFHPDENNVALLAADLNKKTGEQFLTQGTFSYGSLPAYIAYLLKSPLEKTGLCSSSDFTCSLSILRFISATASLLTVLIAFIIAKNLWGTKFGLYTAATVTFLPGMIQPAHFGTSESVLTLLYTCLFWFCLKLINQPKSSYLLKAVLIVSLASAFKINYVLYLFLPIFSFIAGLLLNKPVFSKKLLLKKSFFAVLIFIAALGLIPLLSPYYTTPEFWRMLEYERGVVSGTLDVFYTRQFIQTTPLFPLTSIFPYILNPVLWVGFILFFILTIVNLIRKKFRFRKDRLSIDLLIVIFFLALFIPNILLFTKWTRYFVPLLPIITIGTVSLLHKIEKSGGKLNAVISYTTLAFTVLLGVAFFSIYTRADIRFTASSWINDNLSIDSVILSESGNVFSLPLSVNPYKGLQVVDFDFYNLDKQIALQKSLPQALQQANYIFVPSRRVFKNMGQHPEKYPRVAQYYRQLFSGNLGFTAIKEISSYPQFNFLGWKLEFPDEQAEETWTVFDHPVIRIYQKEVPFTEEDYAKRLEI